MDKWFDLGARGSLRWRTEGPIEMLRLELARPPSRERLIAAREAGWTLPDATNTSVIDNHTNFTRATEIAKALEAFFKPNEIREFYKVTMVEVETAERPKETADSLTPTDIIKVFGDDAPPGLVERARRVIETAQAITGARTTGPDELPFFGDGLRILGRLTERVGAVAAALWFGHVARAIGRTDDWPALQNDLVEAAIGGPVRRPARFAPAVEAAVAYAQRTHEAASFGSLERHLRGAALRGVNIGYQALDGANEPPSSTLDLNDLRLRTDPPIQSPVARDMARRIALALEAIGAVTGVPASRLAQIISFRLTMQPCSAEPGLIATGPGQIGHLVADIGRALATAAGAPLDDAIRAHPIFTEVLETVRTLQRAELIGDRAAQQLTSPREIFARTLDAFLAGRAAASGSVATVGGSLATLHGPPLARTAPIRDFAPTLGALRAERERPEARPARTTSTLRM